MVSWALHQAGAALMWRHRLHRGRFMWHAVAGTMPGPRVTFPSAACLRAVCERWLPGHKQGVVLALVAGAPVAVGAQGWSDGGGRASLAATLWEGWS